MKDQFIEKDGLLFLRCEPEPLEIDKHGKSLVRYIQDDTRMGLYNKEAVCEEKALEKVLLYEPRNIYIAGDHHTRFEVIAKHCPEGSREWALWKMLNGEKAKDGCKIYEEPRRGTPDWAWKQMLAGKEVYRYDYDRNYRMNVCGYVISTDGDYAYNYNQFLNIEHADDWLVHEIPKVGEWYKRGYNYYQCSSVHKHEEGTHVYLRKAGDKVSRHKIYMTKSYGELVPASLTPNFKDAKIGDKCFSIIDGPSEITQLSTDSRPLPVGYLSVSGADRVCCNNGFELGRKMYPTLFHSAKQAVAYFAEVALKEENDG